MSRSIFVLVVCAALAAFYQGCATQCNNVPQNPMADGSMGPTPTPGPRVKEAPVPTATPGFQFGLNLKPSPTPKPGSKPYEAGDLVQISTPTGAKQCGVDKGISIESVKKTLTSNKIEVIEAQTQSDGLMHTAMCGAPSGTIHVFTIPKKNLKKALGLGYKVFKPIE